MAVACDEFSDYPMPQRATNWTLPNPKRHSRASPLRETNLTRDIEGAVSGTTSYFKARRFTNKPNLFGTQDIFGATTHTLHPERCKPMDMSLKTKDIDRCTSGLVHLTTHRNVNPLSPTYHLPSISPAVARALRQTDPSMTAGTSLHSPPRDTMKISDIGGTRAKLAYTRQHPRDPLDCSDIPQKHPNERRSRRTESNALTTSDIMRGPDHLTSRRETNPLLPEYSVPLPNHKTMVIGDVSGSHSTPFKPLRKDRPMLSLRSDDVEGARPGDPYKKKSYI
jgi:hypothetical protein